jgi:hypothetical protein
MRVLFLFLMILFFAELSAQSNLLPPIVDTCFSKDQIINIANDIRQKQEKIDKLETLNDVLLEQSEINDRLHFQDSVYIDIQARQIHMLEDQVNLQLKTYKRKWYQSPTMNFIAGALTITLGAVVLDLATD